MWRSGFAQDGVTYQHMKKLIKLRKSTPALRHGEVVFRWTSNAEESGPGAGLLAYERISAEQTALVVINNNDLTDGVSGEAALGQTANAEGVGMSVSFPPGATLVDLLNPNDNQTFTVNAEGQVIISLPPRSARVLTSALINIRSRRFSLAETPTVQRSISPSLRSHEGFLERLWHIVFCSSLCVLIAVSLLCGPVSCDDQSPIRLPSVRQCALEIRYEPPHFPTELTVEVEGQSHPLSLLDPTRGDAGLWGIDLWLDPGLKSYHLSLDGREIKDPKQPLSAYEDGLERSLVRISDCSRGRWFRVSSSRKGNAVSFFLAFERGLSLEQKKARRGVRANKSLVSESIEVSIDGDAYPTLVEGETITISSTELSRGKHHLSIMSRDEAGRVAERFETPFWVEDQPHRWERGIMYQVVLDRLSTAARGKQSVDPDTPSIGARWEPT